jgi:FtsZ-interacting cell division protein ZipA
LGPSVEMNDQVEMSPPMLPSITFSPIAEERAVSETTFAETWELVRAPKEKAPVVIMKVAP